MQAYDEYAPNTSFHSISEKNFLGTTIPALTKPTTDADVKIALDTLFNHPNVGPFIGKQLIQRLVTSNPSPAYVGRVAAAFNNNGQGVRGDMKAVVKAILLDPEARTVGTSASAGKVREPVLRLAHMLRAFNATSTSGRYTGIGLTDDPSASLGQTPMFAPTVFNFFRPGYVPTSKAITDANLVAPEMQIVTDVSVAGYMNYIRGWTQLNTTRDIQHNYDAEMELARDAGGAGRPDEPAAVLGHDAGRPEDADLDGGRQPRDPGPGLPARHGGERDSDDDADQPGAIDAATLDRVYLAVFLSMASPDYLIQK